MVLIATFVHGKGGYFQLDNAAGTLVDLSQYLDNVGFPSEVDAAETTAFGNNDKTYIVGLGDQKISLTGKWDSTLDTHMTAAIAAQKAGTLASASWVFGPAGSTTGKPKYSGEAIITSFELDDKVSDVITWKSDLQTTGTTTRGVF